MTDVRCCDLRLEIASFLLSQILRWALTSVGGSFSSCHVVENQQEEPESLYEIEGAT